LQISPLKLIKRGLTKGEGDEPYVCAIYWGQRTRKKMTHKHTHTHTHTHTVTILEGDLCLLTVLINVFD